LQLPRSLWERGAWWSPIKLLEEEELVGSCF
jgi:hypothetical protein